MDSTFALVEKEVIAGLHFPTTEVLKSEKETLALKMEMERAIALGNLEHHKVKI